MKTMYFSYNLKSIISIVLSMNSGISMRAKVVHCIIGFVLCCMFSVFSTVREEHLVYKLAKNNRINFPKINVLCSFPILAINESVQPSIENARHAT